MATRSYRGVAAAAAFAWCVVGCGHGNDNAPDAVGTPSPPPATPTASPARFFAAANVVVRSDDAGSTWQALSIGAVGIDFVDRHVGGAIDGIGLFRTTDGGDSWIDQITNVTERDRVGILRDVALPSRDDAIVVGGEPADTRFDSAALILVTHDGGSTWSVADINSKNPALSRSPLRFVCVTGSGTGFTCGQGLTSNVCLRSTDRGDTWTDISDRITANFGTCAGNTDLWVLLARLIFHSTDAGETWIDVTSTLPESVRSSTIELIAVEFVSARVGWIGGATAPGFAPMPVLLHTEDAGASWMVQHLPSEHRGALLAIAFADELHGVALGGGVETPFAFATEDGGNSWHDSQLPSTVRQVFNATAAK